MNNLRNNLWILLVVLLLLALVAGSGCKKQQQSSEGGSALPANSLELVFTYGSEKEKWITEVTAQFNREGHRTASGKPIFVRALPMGEIMIGQLWRFRFNPN